MDRDTFAWMTIISGRQYDICKLTINYIYWTDGEVMLIGNYYFFNLKDFLNYFANRKIVKNPIVH